MAVAASGLEIDQLFDKYLYQPFNMTSTTWSPLKNPQLAVGITTTADDFENLLFRLLTYKVGSRRQPPCARPTSPDLARDLRTRSPSGPLIATPPPA